MGGYEVSRDGASIGTTTNTSYTDGSRTPATTYQYKVRAYDLASPTNYSVYTTQIPVTTPDTIAPSAPGAPTFSTVTGGSAHVDWSPATDNVGVAGYQYRLSTNGGSTWANWVGTGGTGINLSGLSAATTYTMQVQAYDTAPVPNYGPSSSGSFATASVYTENLQLTVGSTSGAWGYLQGAYGALSPNTLSYGKTVTQVTSTATVFCTNPQDPTSCGVNWATYFVVAGFSANPAATWLQASGMSGLTGATAVFSYSGGVGTWYWPSAGLPTSGTVTLTVVHP